MSIILEKFRKINYNNLKSKWARGIVATHLLSATRSRQVPFSPGPQSVLRSLIRSRKMSEEICDEEVRAGKKGKGEEPRRGTSEKPKQ